MKARPSDLVSSPDLPPTPPMPATTPPPNHRTRVGAERRERMRQRLIETAMIVFADKGVRATVIPDVVAAAEVSQGSFYNYFRTNDELLAAVAQELSMGMIEAIEGVVADIADPALRVATGIRFYLHLARGHRLLARFIAACGAQALDERSGVMVLPADLAEGWKRGDFDLVSLDAAADVVIGAGWAAIVRMAQGGRIPKEYPDQIAAVILRALGVSAATADRLVATPLPKLAVAPDSLLARAQARAAAKADAE